jgi:SAM-dependent methyltransferase
MSGQYINRFTGRGEDYAKYRPGYPKEIIGILAGQAGFNKDKVVADIGSGTGLLSRVFLENGNRVFGVEPNAEMRSFAEKDLSRFEKFTSVNGSAENTGLANNSIDLIIIGQALHWFDRDESKKEFVRILKTDDSYVLIVYNERKDTKKGEAGLTDEYGRVIKKHKKTGPQTPDIDDEYLSKFFKLPYKKFSLPNEQSLDFDGLLGRAASASYLPTKNEEGFDSMKKDLGELFNAYEQNGRVTLEYTTFMYLGRISTENS